MREFKNKLDRSLTMEEMETLIEAAKILSKGFKRPIYQIVVNPNEHLKTDVWGISFALDLDAHR